MSDFATSSGFLDEVSASLDKAKSNNSGYDDEVAGGLALVAIDRELGIYGQTFDYSKNATRFKALAKVANALPQYFDNPNGWDNWLDAPKDLKGLGFIEATKAATKGVTAGFFSTRKEIKILAIAATAIAVLLIIKEARSLLSS